MMLDEHRTPQCFWPDAISTACYISNRIFMRSILNLIPFELLFGRKSSVSHLRSFGCKCFVLKYGFLDKFESRSFNGILLGYTPHDRSYRVFNLKTNTSAPRVVWTSMWSVHALRFGPHHARRCPVAWAHVPEQSSRRLAKGELPQAAPRHTL
jgi:hypothetical protein